MWSMLSHPNAAFLFLSFPFSATACRWATVPNLLAVYKVFTLTGLGPRSPSFCVLIRGERGSRRERTFNIIKRYLIDLQSGVAAFETNPATRG
ncbi:hypothetical protein BO82DRAFT_183772 [Aspergillus uvarum CBS 121591]|uniref:Secreted protein n=1 Tax=Aspergillus uvarum CBS 121591 TaxID=1448315 RepID=A0A319DBA4_9EURO|nr:hypothetical protein BO82DRAFT_183772 [Aspergillus uvarum CBS 121591]PYH85348.1 hypothetical protein BO82DRAFT_183772 [Aspergillus uvarum CBS 121591]